MIFLECTEAQPIPTLPAFDACIATEVFEHLHDPVRYFAAIDIALRSGGYLVTQIGDHRKEFFHVSPELGALRKAITDKSYGEITTCRLYRKPVAVAS
jgi:cyclopropane fatty-acyl-phospholipid synthase-like methyltransferase